jgi:hypothetical protein
LYSKVSLIAGIYFGGWISYGPYHQLSGDSWGPRLKFIHQLVMTAPYPDFHDQLLIQEVLEKKDFIIYLVRYFIRKNPAPAKPWRMRLKTDRRNKFSFSPLTASQNDQQALNGIVLLGSINTA